MHLLWQRSTPPSVALCALALGTASMALVGCSGGQRAKASCASDTECLGGRICNEHGRCAEPDPSSAALWADAAVPVVPDASPDAMVPVTGPGPHAMFGGDERNSGALAGEAPLKAPKELWRLELEKPIVGSPTVGPDGTIYITSHDHKLYAVSSLGKILWSFASQDRMWSTPAVAEDGTVYTGSDDDHLYAIDGKTGEEKWRFRVGDCADPLGFGPEGTRCDVDGGPTIGSDGTIYTGGDGLYAVWPNGKLRWKFATAEHVPTAPAIGEDGMIYIGCLDDAVYAVNPDGSKAWEFRTRRDIESSVAVGAGGVVYFGGDDGGVYAVDERGEQKWTVITRGPVRGSPAIGADGTIYAGSHDKRLYAIGEDGQVKWRFTAADKIHGSIGVAQNGVLLFGSQDDNVYAVADDGRLLWYLPRDGDVDPTPALAQDGTLYVVGDDKSLRAYR